MNPFNTSDHNNDALEDGTCLRTFLIQMKLRYFDGNSEILILSYCTCTGRM